VNKDRNKYIFILGCRRESSVECHTIQIRWRRQDLLRGGAKMEIIMSRGTHEARVQQLLDD